MANQSIGRKIAAQDLSNQRLASLEKVFVPGSGPEEYNLVREALCQVPVSYRKNGFPKVQDSFSSESVADIAEALSTDPGQFEDFHYLDRNQAEEIPYPEDSQHVRDDLGKALKALYEIPTDHIREPTGRSDDPNYSSKFRGNGFDGSDLESFGEALRSY